MGGVASSPSDGGAGAPPQEGSTWWLPPDRVSLGLIPGDLSGRSGHLRGWGTGENEAQRTDQRLGTTTCFDERPADGPK